MNACRSCGAPIEWVKSASSGKLIPLDIEPRADGNLVVITGLVHSAKARVGDELLRVSHFATCPQAASWRGKR